MAKFAGLAMSMTLDDSGGSSATNISNDVASITLSDTRGEQDITGIDKSAMERLQLLADTDITLTGNGWPSSATLAVLATNMSAARTLVLNWPDSGTYTVEVMIFSFGPTRGADGGITWTANLKLSNGTAGAWS